MAYVKKFKGERETGKMIDCIITGDDGVEKNLGQYPETERVYETVWETKYRPEHVPVGSVVRYHLNHRNEGVKEAVVASLHQNDIDSWVIKTDIPCSILGMDHKEAFNLSYITEIVSRGTGTCRPENVGTSNSNFFKMDYLCQQQSLPVGVKRKHLYAAVQATVIVAYVLYNHPDFVDLDNDEHIYDYVNSMTQKLKHLFTRTEQGAWSGYCTVNKKRLVKELRVLMMHSRQSKAKLIKEEKKRQREEYERDMRSFDETLC